MCGRFTLINKKAVREKLGINIKANFNIAPSNSILILASEPKLVYWGLSPFWAKKSMNLINARIETINEKPAFLDTLPCLVVTDGWYEWRKSNTSEKYPFYFHKHGEIFYMAGIFNEMGCAILTKKSSHQIANVHHRQPILLNKLGRRAWVKESNILAQHYCDKITFHRVGMFVNSPKCNDPICVKPIS